MTGLDWDKAKRDSKRPSRPPMPLYPRKEREPRPAYVGGYVACVLRYPGRCYVCEKLIRAGVRGYWSPDSKRVRCSLHEPAKKH
jgi:hypothetical protein